MRPGTKAVRKEIKLKLLVEEFFSALDKFVYIANYILKDVEVVLMKTSISLYLGLDVLLNGWE